ncbi:MAG: hypothetical protein CMF62_03645 [Magnetococcales bacterium]|nr:hypothetical protein [Magnetococcales bacterium]|tara:strand:- start:20639 stop:21583 length:945 start_codon:yes stop_codon:yes gene_type:complete
MGNNSSNPKVLDTYNELSLNSNNKVKFKNNIINPKKLDIKFIITPKDNYIYESDDLFFKIIRTTESGKLKLMIPKIDKNLKNVPTLIEYQTKTNKQSYNFLNKFSEILLNKTKPIVNISNNKFYSIAPSLNLGLVNSKYLNLFTVIDCYITDMDLLLNNNVMDSLYETFDYYYNLINGEIVEYSSKHKKIKFIFNYKLFGLQLTINPNKILYERELIGGILKIEIPYMHHWNKTVKLYYTPNIIFNKNLESKEIELNSLINPSSRILFHLDKNFDLHYFTENIEDDINYVEIFERKLIENINLIFENDYKNIVG